MLRCFCHWPRLLAPATVVNAKDPLQVARYVKPFVVAGLKAPI